MLLSKSYSILYTKTLLGIDLDSYLLSKIVVKNDGDTNLKANILLNNIYLLSSMLIPSASYRIFQRRLGLNRYDKVEIEVFNANLTPGSSNSIEGFIETQKTYRNFLYSQHITRDFLAAQQRLNTVAATTPVNVTLYYLN